MCLNLILILRLTVTYLKQITLPAFSNGTSWGGLSYVDHLEVGYPYLALALVSSLVYLLELVLSLLIVLLIFLLS
jgi:hypothetical protein